jgi:predicted transcriptional regulator
MKTFKERHQFYLPDDLSEKLEAMAKEPGSSKTAILTDALRTWFERRAANELDVRFGIRLDRISQANERLEK